jgi:hypothetical protein
MTTCQTLAKPEIANCPLHREVPRNDPRKSWDAGLKLDAVANLAVLCAGVAIVVLAAASDGQLFLLSLTA